MKLRCIFSHSYNKIGIEVRKTVGDNPPFIVNDVFKCNRCGNHIYVYGGMTLDTPVEFNTVLTDEA